MSASFTTVREVIEKLQKLPQDAIVVMSYEEPWDTGEGQVDGVGGFVLMDGYESRSGWNLIDAYDTGLQPQQLVVMTVNGDGTSEMVFETMSWALEEAIDTSDSPVFKENAGRTYSKIEEELNEKPNQSNS